VDDWVRSTPQNIKPCPEAKNGVHRWIWHAAYRLAATGIPPAEAEAYIMARLTRQPDPPNEVTASIAKAYRLQTELPKNTRWNGIPFEKPEFCPNKLKRIAASMDGVEANWLARRSSVRVDNRTPGILPPRAVPQGRTRSCLRQIQVTRPGTLDSSGTTLRCPNPQSVPRRRNGGGLVSFQPMRWQVPRRPPPG
jgi:hypothetical protein